MEVECKVSGRRVSALSAGEVVGQIVVPDISFHWGRGAFIPLAGIGGVGTDERFRRAGIGSRMMKEAVRLARECGYGGSAVSTSTSNIARRLYSKGGYVHLFSMHQFSRQPQAEGDVPSCPGVSIRPYEGKDLSEVLALIRETETPFFGSREKTPERWVATRARSNERVPALAFVALRDGGIVGFADRFFHWDALTGEVFVRPGPEQFQVGEVLLAALEQAAGRLGEEGLCFWATDCEDFPVRLLRNRGYELTRSRVFKFNIVSLQRFLVQLGEVFRRRAAGLDASELPASIELLCDGETEKLDPGGLGGRLVLQASREVVTNVVCGMYSAWDAYLRGVMEVRPSVEPQVRRVLEALLPAVPFQHPVNDWW